MRLYTNRDKPTSIMANIIYTVPTSIVHLTTLKTVKKNTFIGNKKKDY